MLALIYCEAGGGDGASPYYIIIDNTITKCIDKISTDPIGHNTMHLFDPSMNHSTNVPFIDIPI